MKLFSDEIQQVLAEFENTKNALHETRFELRKKIEELEAVNKKLEDSKDELRQKIEDLQRNEKAMINLLEDARDLEKNLKKERDLSKAVISSMGEGLLVVDKEQKVILVNQAASVLLRRAPNDMVGKNINEVLKICQGKNNDVKNCNLPIEQLIREPNIVNIELEDDFYCQNRDGNFFPAAVIMASLLHSVLKDAVRGVVIIFRNISKEKSLDEAKTGFISIASHQLRTPLTSIRWFSEMLLDGDAGDLSEDQKHFVERVYQGADRMINLVNLLLQIARVEAGRVKIEPKPIDFKLITEGVIMTLQNQLNEKKQKIKIVTEPKELPKIPMDEEVLWQIVQNLLTNAVRYSPLKGIITIKITINNEKQELCYAVEDKGIGIPKEEQNRIFEKFFRADNASRYVPEGSGLGLNLVKKLVEDWNGRIWFESEEGKGATFFFTVSLEGVKAKDGEVKLKVD